MLEESAEPRKFSELVGRQLRAFRESGGVTADRLATLARELGLDWHRSTVAAIENGDRGLRAEELLLLPVLLWAAHDGRQFELKDFLPPPDDQREVVMAPGLVLPADVVSELLTKPVDSNLYENVKTRSGQSSNQTATPAQARRQRFQELVPRLWPGASLVEMAKAESTVGQAERKAARKLGVEVEVLAIAAHGLWGRRLTDERDDRVSARSTEHVERRTLQARRGHVTRVLLQEVKEHLEGSH